MLLFYPHIKWTIGQKILFRLLFIFIILNILPFPLDAFLFFIPQLSQVYSSLTDTMVPFFGNTVLGLDYDINLAENGSGDKSKDYVKLFMYGLLAFSGMLIWSFADRKRKSYDTLYHYFIILCRYYLAFTLLGYGWEKVLKLQMSQVNLNQLLMPVGDQTPMGLAWKFIGFSDLYCRFSGWVEVIGGVLLLFRKTTLFGALFSMTVMINVMMLNFGYNIPVKLYSSLLVLMCMIVVSPYFKRLFTFFFSSQTSVVYAPKPLFEKRWQKNTRYIIKFIVLILFIGFGFMKAHETQMIYGENVVKPPLYGIYQTETYTFNGDTIPLYSDSTAWKRLVFNWPNVFSVYKFSDKRYPVDMKMDTVTKTIRFNFRNDSNTIYNFNYKKLNDSIFNFAGTNKKDTFNITAKRQTRDNFLLYKTGFHWINEKPNNR